MIKVLALDIYGTVLASDDADNELPPRMGIEWLFNECKNRKIRIVSASDSNIDNVKIDLGDSFKVAKLEHLVDQFEKYYHLDDWPKDFSEIIRDYSLSPEELLVIGNEDKDVLWPMKNNCLWLKIPSYIGPRMYGDFDFSKDKSVLKLIS